MQPEFTEPDASMTAQKPDAFPSTETCKARQPLEVQHTLGAMLLYFPGPPHQSDTGSTDYLGSQHLVAESVDSRGFDRSASIASTRLRVTESRHSCDAEVNFL